MKKSLAVFLPVMLCFFTMGFVDLVGIASNYVQKDLGLTDSGGTYLIIRLVSGEQLTFFVLSIEICIFGEPNRLI